MRKIRSKAKVQARSIFYIFLLSTAYILTEQVSNSDSNKNGSYLLHFDQVKTSCTYKGFKFRNIQEIQDQSQGNIDKKQVEIICYKDNNLQVLFKGAYKNDKSSQDLISCSGQMIKSFKEFNLTLNSIIQCQKNKKNGQKACPSSVKIIDSMKNNQQQKEIYFQLNFYDITGSLKTCNIVLQKVIKCDCKSHLQSESQATKQTIVKWNGKCQKELDQLKNKVLNCQNNCELKIESYMNVQNQCQNKVNYYKEQYYQYAYQMKDHQECLNKVVELQIQLKKLNYISKEFQSQIKSFKEKQEKRKKQERLRIQRQQKLKKQRAVNYLQRQKLGQPFLYNLDMKQAHARQNHQIIYRGSNQLGTQIKRTNRNGDQINVQSIEMLPFNKISNFAFIIKESKRVKISIGIGNNHDRSKQACHCTDSLFYNIDTQTIHIDGKDVDPIINGITVKNQHKRKIRIGQTIKIVVDLKQYQKGQSKITFIVGFNQIISQHIIPQHLVKQYPTVLIKMYDIGDKIIID